MDGSQSLQGFKIALLIDFDNVELGVEPPGFDPELVVNALRSRGIVVMGRAYGDWYRHNRHRRKLMEHGIELVETPAFGPIIKNSADIRIVLDAFEIAMLQHHIDAFCLVSGDSDFLPLIKKLQYLGKHVIVISGNKFTSDLVRRNCNEFVSYENLLAESMGATEDASTLEGAFSLLSRGIATLHERGMEVRSSTVKQMMLQLNPAFSERNFSCAQFKQFLDKAVKAGIVKLGGRDTTSGEFLVFLSSDFDDSTTTTETSAPAQNGTANGTVSNGKAPLSPLNGGAKDVKERSRPERRTRRDRPVGDNAPTSPDTATPENAAPVSPVELGAAAASGDTAPTPTKPATGRATPVDGSEPRPTTPNALLGRGMRRGRLRFSGKAGRAEFAASTAAGSATESGTDETRAAEAIAAGVDAENLVTGVTTGVVNEATAEDAAPAAFAPEAELEAQAAKVKEPETVEAEATADALAPKQVARQAGNEDAPPTVSEEPIASADEFTAAANAELADEVTETAESTTEAAPKKRVTRRGGRGKGKKAATKSEAGASEAEAASEAGDSAASSEAGTVSSTRDATDSSEPVTATPAPAEVTAPATPGDAVSSPEAAQESAAAPDAASGTEVSGTEAPAKPARRALRPKHPAPRRRPAASKKKETDSEGA